MGQNEETKKGLTLKGELENVAFQVKG